MSNLDRRIDAIEVQLQQRRRGPVDWAAVSASVDRKLEELAAQIAREYPDGLPALSEEERQDLDAYARHMRAEAIALEAIVCGGG